MRRFPTHSNVERARSSGRPSRNPAGTAECRDLLVPNKDVPLLGLLKAGNELKGRRLAQPDGPRREKNIPRGMSRVTRVRQPRSVALRDTHKAHIRFRLGGFSHGWPRRCGSRKPCPRFHEKESEFELEQESAGRRSGGLDHDIQAWPAIAAKDAAIRGPSQSHSDARVDGSAR